MNKPVQVQVLSQNVKVMKSPNPWVIGKYIEDVVGLVSAVYGEIGAMPEHWDMIMRKVDEMIIAEDIGFIGAVIRTNKHRYAVFGKIGEVRKGNVEIEVIE